MKRRKFLEWTGAAGFGLAHACMLGDAFAGPSVSMRRPAPAGSRGPLFVQIQAGGGWDPTILCDPKPALSRTWGQGDVRSVGNIEYMSIDPVVDAFFETHANRMLVVNGIDTTTNSHTVGTRFCASGSIGEGYPVLAAMVAGAHAPELPMSLLTFGGYDRTSGAVAPTRDLQAGKVAELAYPNRINPNSSSSRNYHEEATRALVDGAREQRAQRLLAERRLPRYVDSMQTMITARAGAEQLARLEQDLPTPDPDDRRRRLQLVVAAYKAEICAAASVNYVDFDTHDDHDAKQRSTMAYMFGEVSFLWEEAQRQGVADDLVVAITSDFGRTPAYNAGNGKDHWPITSMIVMGAGVPGNRVLGASDEGHNPLYFDPHTLEPVSAGSTTKTRIGPDHVHKNLRRLLGVDGSTVDEAFPITVEHDVDLLG